MSARHGERPPFRRQVVLPTRGMDPDLRRPTLGYRAVGLGSVSSDRSWSVRDVVTSRRFSVSALHVLAPVSVPTPVVSHTCVQPSLSPWRRDVSRMHLELYADGRLYCLRPHPHMECSGFFKFSRSECATLLAGWSDAPLHSVTVSQHTKVTVSHRVKVMTSVRCLASRLPDGGVQLLRVDRHGKRAATFRILADDVADFLTLCRRAAFVF